MSTATPTSIPTTEASGPTAVPATPRSRATIRPIPFTRLAGVELRKMFDTRAGFWLMASVAILAVLATAGVILFVTPEFRTYEAYASAIGIPLSIILPMIAILSITSEYTQRTGLTTYTLVPRRGRVIAAKLVLAVLVGVVSMFVALGIGALGNVVGSLINGTDAVWDVTAAAFAKIVLASVIGMLMGFMLGAVIRNSAGAIVGYFVYSFVLPTVFMALAAFQDWFADAQPWLDVNYASTRLYDGAMTAESWAQLGVTSMLWLWVPLALGIWALHRAEVK